jgi:hypothetical protein
VKQVVQLDGWRIAIDWNKLVYSDSFFVPSVNWKQDRAALVKSAANCGVGIGIKGVTEDEVRGLRVWCTQPKP